MSIMKSFKKFNHNFILKNNQKILSNLRQENLANYSLETKEIISDKLLELIKEIQYENLEQIFKITQFLLYINQ